MIQYSKSSRAFWIDGPTGVEYILPLSALTELRKAPDSTLDAALANEDVLYPGLFFFINDVTY
jgi:hypothetical protein